MLPRNPRSRSQSTSRASGRVSCTSRSSARCAPVPPHPLLRVHCIRSSICWGVCYNHQKTWVAEAVASAQWQGRRGRRGGIPAAGRSLLACGTPPRRQRKFHQCRRCPTHRDERLPKIRNGRHRRASQSPRAGVMIPQTLRLVHRNLHMLLQIMNTSHAWHNGVP